MIEYPKIPTLWRREAEPPYRLLVGEYATPELKELSLLPWYATEKLNGTNVRIGWDGHAVKIGGRTDNAQMSTALFEYLTRRFGGESAAQVFEQAFGACAVTLYGEGIGPKVQNGGWYSDELLFVLFDVWVSGDKDQPQGWWLEPGNVADVASKFGLRTPRLVFDQETPGHISQEVARGIVSAGWKEERPMEGIVARPRVQLFDRRGTRIGFKLKTSDFRNSIDYPPAPSAELPPASSSGSV